MKTKTLRAIWKSPLIMGSLMVLQGCLVGRVMDSTGTPIPNMDVVAIGQCSGAGCAAHETQVQVGTELKTGYRTTSDDNGYYMWDPYAYNIPTEDAMFVYAPADATDKALDLLFVEPGYQTVMLHHVPEYKEYTDSSTGEKYLIAQAPAIYLCRDDEFDADGDGICDEAEKMYGTSYLNPDTDKDGVSDKAELYDFGTPPGDLDTCVFAYCTSDVIGCTNDVECSDWLDCMEGCAADDLLCATQCGAFYQSPTIDALSTCALDNGCAYVEFPDLPACNLPATPEVPVGNFDGFWWVSAINGGSQVLFDDCQRFIFTELDATQIDVDNSTLVTVNNSTETRVAYNHGTFTRDSGGFLELVYDNWAGYKEQYHPYYVSDNAMVMHVCSVGSDAVCHEYATLVLTRVPLNQLTATETADLEASLQSVFQQSMIDFTLIGTDSCPNAI